MVVIVMGVSGCGKTTVGQILAHRLPGVFFDGDDYHPAANVRKMRSGQPLEDMDRWSWLMALRNLIEEQYAARRPAVIACSALKRKYRDVLRGVYSADQRDVFLSCRESSDTSVAFPSADLPNSPLDGNGAAQLVFAHLAGTREVIASRLAGRKGHFMPTKLLESQFVALEPPEGEPGVVSIDIADGDACGIAGQLLEQLRAPL